MFLKHTVRRRVATSNRITNSGYIRRLISVLMILCFTLSLSTTCFAVDKDKAAAAIESGDYSDPVTWWQGRVPADGGRRLHGGTGSTVGEAACSYFSTSYMLTKMGELKPSKGETPLTLIDKADAAGAWEQDWGLLDFRRINELYSNVSMVDWKMGLPGGFENAKAVIKGKMDEGLFCVVCVVGGGTSGHYIFIDGFESDGRMVIGDSAFPGTHWEDYYAGAGTYMAHLTTFKHASKTPGDCPSIYSGIELDEEEAEPNAEEQEIIDEWNLEGMKGRKSKLLDESNPPTLPNFDDLSDYEKRVATEIGDAQKQEKPGLISIGQRVSSVIGIALLFYAVLLLVALVFDRVNSFIEVSIVSVITLGKINVMDKDELKELSPSERHEYITTSGVVKRVVIIFVVGLILVSGWVFDLMYWLLVRAGVCK